MKNELIKNAFILSFGAFVAKFLGAVYRIPLTNILGSYGLGLYQMVFPVYTLLLDFSGAGAPNAISKIISSFSKEDKQNYAFNILYVSKKIFSFLGLAFSLVLISFSYLISFAQGNTDSTLSYILLSPSIFLVCILSSYRGYFQGLMNMCPTALSQIIEQLVKISLGLVFAFLFRNNVIYAVAGAIFAITISEFIAVIFLKILFIRNKRKNNLVFTLIKSQFSSNCKRIIKTTIPITLIGIMIPFSQVADSFIIVNILKSYMQNATSLYGILTGVVNTIINLPVFICYSIATVIIPMLSREREEKSKRKNTVKAMVLTMIVSFGCAVIIFLFANRIIDLLFSRLNSGDREISIKLLKLMSINVVLLSMLQTTNGILIGSGKLYFPLISMGVGVVIKIILNIMLISNKKINIYGGGIALITCFFICNLINLIMIIIKDKKNASKITTNRQLQN